MQQRYLEVFTRRGSPHERDHEEADMEIVRLPITHFEEKLRTGQIRDVCTIAAWGSYQLWLRSNR